MYCPQGARSIGLRVRLCLDTDNRQELDHFFTPSSMWRSWLRCAYTAISHLPYAAAHGPTVRRGSAHREREVWFIAKDSTEAKIKMMLGVSRQKGAAKGSLNLERVTTVRQRAMLLRLAAPTSSAGSE